MANMTLFITGQLIGAVGFVEFIGCVPALRSRLCPIGPPLRYGPMSSLRFERLTRRVEEMNNGAKIFAFGFQSD